MQAIAQLRANSTIHVHMEFPAWGQHDRSYTLALLHDLRFVADNMYANVHVFVHAELRLRSQLLAWLRAFGGLIIFHEDDRLVRDINLEWIEPVEDYTAKGDDSDDEGRE
jgi:hypothetical protein